MDSVSVWFLDVGQGDCTFVLPGPRGPGAPTLMFDCNDGYVAERFVVDHDLDNLVVVLSHLDRDHIQGVLPFLKWYLTTWRPTETVPVHVQADREMRGKALKRLRQTLGALRRWHEQGRVSLRGAVREDSPRTILEDPTTSAWAVDLLLPHHVQELDMHLKYPDAANRMSAALRARCGPHSLLIGGDVPLVSWETLDTLPRVAVVRSPHHGGKIDEGGGTLSLEALYQGLGAEVVVHSVGTNNGHSHPRVDHLTASRRGGACRVLCTQLTPRCDPRPLTQRASALRNPARVVYPYRHRAAPGSAAHGGHRRRRETPCAGSILVELSSSLPAVAVDPLPGDWHDAFVSTLYSAKCL